MISNIISLFKNYKYIGLGVLGLYAIVATTIIKIQSSEIKVESAKAEEAQRAYKMVVSSTRYAETVVKQGETKKNVAAKKIESAGNGLSDDHVFSDDDANKLRELTRQINANHGIR